MSEAPAPPDLEMVAAEGPWGGPVFRYRGAEIRCLKGGHVCGLVMPGHPLHGHAFGVAGILAINRRSGRPAPGWARRFPRYSAVTSGWLP